VPGTPVGAPKKGDEGGGGKQVQKRQFKEVFRTCRGGGSKLKMRSFLFFVFRKYSQGVRKKTETLQHAATMYGYVYVYMYTYATHCHFGTLWWNTFSAAHCNTLQHTATHIYLSSRWWNTFTAAHCSTLQHTAAHCNTLQHTATHCNTLQHAIALCNTLQHPATHCNTQLPRYMVVEQVLGMLVELGAEMTCRNMLLISYHIKYIYVTFISIYV